ncbi:SDR family NAD(P)-dependent oxidoreductase [Megalodesulfovibrio gigas]|uniref:Putative SDR-like protein n=1 Tax=Megalodesulfovibrio gigas (strain ATCC 19364 / DSM 1382 / NCIMB 9332 / VKM B-1759) TaxID=1121448 RepID=T2GA31_MEGG1|nr:SDR family oxidoreductase [Megalodesulfovibrio gigas]AGW13455.1 putative SDR-like protein [Megalodesulfovibrio gigas DSM 1382 = ATCC 19364]
MSWLANKTIVLTGASHGIGRALADALAMQGANLVLNARSKPPLKEAKKTLEAGYKIKVAVVDGDAATARVARACVEQAETLGGFAGIIHAAGVLHPGPHLWELDEKQYDDVTHASCKASWQLARAAYPALMRQKDGGLYVLFGSGAASIAMPGIGLYCAAKAFEEHLMRQLAAETDAVTCFVYQPGKVETRMQQQAREATGGGGEAVRATFTPWHERGELLSAQASAVWLARLLQEDPRPWHGHIVRVGQV